MKDKTAPVSITPDKNYDSDFCGSIPLHLVNLIQPHGVLLVLDKVQLRIVQASENVEQQLEYSVDDLLDKALSDLIPANQYAEIQEKINSNQEKIPFVLSFSVGGRDVVFTALVHAKEEYILIELEEGREDAGSSFIGLYQQIKYITSLLKQAPTIEETAQLAAREIKKISGFDRVLVYQFDPNWNGIVIAQAKEESMSDYLDLRFPASDVPRQARELYFKNPYRLIPTHDYKPVRLIPVINPINQRFTDLSECNLRSVATVHLEYLRNMNIEASMSLPIIINDKLWGLISCHHKTAKNPSYEIRSGMELLSGILSAQLESRAKESAFQLRSNLRAIHTQILVQLYDSLNIADGLLTGKATILQLLSLSGAAIFYEGSTWTTGNTPDKQELKELVSWLRRNKASQTYATDSLPKEYVYSLDFKDIASGLIVLPINAEQGEFILGFREEVLQNVNWGGDPNSAIQIEADGKTYHPRNSFAIYKETVKNTSLPWHEVELEAAEILRSAVLEKIIREK
ncbi:GAF domain-containing protein [Pontibacter vulgaris]|uniref:GAF domain-containing protein n=1 Tax=Pontibacter vulgaris TaxID=2905679 RepID=UPI001FA6DFC1|nr:GAF domain-containing protein [Pontibacter vulgaris]